jgi:multisubunit Na+/H+ antiporter MnhB subunit
MSALLDGLIVLLALVLAHRVATARDDLAAVVAFVGLGLLLALAWVRLRSVDVGLTEAAIGSGATGFLLLRAQAGLRGASAPVQPASPMVKAIASLGSFIFSMLLFVVVLALPDRAPTLAPQAAAALPATGLGNPVTGVLLAFRSLDTLLETVVLFLALLGVWSLAAPDSWNARPTLLAHAPPPALVLLARTLPPIGVMFGIYMFWEGATGPGGAFQAGTVLAAMWILIAVAGLAALPRTGARPLRLMLVAGSVLFTLVGLLGYLFADGFLSYPKDFAKPAILLIEAALTLSIAVTLAYLVAGRPVRDGGPP